MAPIISGGLAQRWPASDPDRRHPADPGWPGYLGSVTSAGAGGRHQLCYGIAL